MRRSMTTLRDSSSSSSSLSITSSIDSSSNYQTLLLIHPPPSLGGSGSSSNDHDSHDQHNLLISAMETSSDLPTDLRLGLSISNTTTNFSLRQQASAEWPPIKTLLRRVLITAEGEIRNYKPGSPLSSSSSSCKQTRQILNNSTSGDNSLFVKVKMEGIKIGRKIDLLSLHGYPHLITTLEHMFTTPNILWAEGEQYLQHKRYYNWSHVLTYEDQDGDWMMVGDVPWEMFLITVRRLKITRNGGGSMKA